MKKTIIECQKPKVLLDTHKPKKIEDINKIEELLDFKEFPKNQSKINFNKSKRINIVLIDNFNRKEFRNNQLQFIEQISKKEGWLLFIYKNLNEVKKINNILPIISKFKEHPYVFGKMKIKEKSYNFENNLESVFGLLVRKEVYECVGGLSFKFFDLDLALYDLARKLSKIFFMIDLSKCGFSSEHSIVKKEMDLEFERDFYASLEREPFQAIAYDKSILES